jgi:hypothetical protein
VPSTQLFLAEKIRSRDFRVKFRRILIVQISSEKYPVFLEFKCKDRPTDGHICTINRGDLQDEGRKTKKGMRIIRGGGN